MPETENISNLIRKNVKTPEKHTHVLGSPLKENFANGEALVKGDSSESYRSNSKKDKSGGVSTAKRFRVIMECELNPGTLCIFDAEEYWTTEMIIKYGCPHRVDVQAKTQNPK